MATKKELLGEAAALGIDVDPKAKIAEIQALINNAEMLKDTGETVAAVETETAEVETIAEATEEAASEETTEADEPRTAKAGKRSAKAVAEAEAEDARQARKEDEVADKPKGAAPKTHSRLERRGKGFRKNAELIEVGKLYSVEEAIALAKKTSHVKFDATVELHVNLGVDPRHADQNIRDTVGLPAGTGKTVKIAVLTDDAAAAIKAGADVAGVDEVLQDLDKGIIGFDILISTPALMAKLGKYARTLGPRGLMPNPKSGTVTTDVAKAVAEAKAGRVEYRVDTTGIVHLGIGKVSFSEADLMQNVNAVLASIKANKPSSVKGNYFKAAHVTTSMGPSVAVDLTTIG